MKHKKAMAIEDLIPLLFFMIVSVIVILFFFFSFVLNATNEIEKVKFEKSEIETNEFLIYYMNFPLENDRSVANLIIDSAAKGEYSELNDISEQIIGDIFPGKSIGIQARDSIGKELFYIPDYLSIRLTAKFGEAFLPSPDITGEIKFIKIEFYK